MLTLDMYLGFLGFLLALYEDCQLAKSRWYLGFFMVKKVFLGFYEKFFEEKVERKGVDAKFDKGSHVG